jgi:hypothetical protein
MKGDREGSWQRRYETGTARDRAANVAWVQRRFGVPLSRTLLQELPWLLGLFLLGFLLQGWLWGLVSAAVLLVVMLAFRAWARRHYGITTVQRPKTS